MAVGAPLGGIEFDLLLLPVLALPDPADRGKGHHVVHAESEPDQPVGVLAVERRDDQLQRLDQMRRHLDVDLPLEQGLANEAQVEVLQVAQAAMDEFAGAAGSAAGEVGALQQRNAEAAHDCVEGDPCAGDPATDDEDVEDCSLRLSRASSRSSMGSG